MNIWKTNERPETWVTDCSGYKKDWLRRQDFNPRLPTYTLTIMIGRNVESGRSSYTIKGAFSDFGLWGVDLSKQLPLTPETEAFARRVVWFEEPEEALVDTFRLAAYAFARATHEDMKLLRSFLNDEDLREALDHAPPGVIDPRSWAYWNLKLGRVPAPPMPKRQL